MTTYMLLNEELEIVINQFGAELKSIRDRNNGNNYLWNGDPSFWGRTSPVLFPLVGALKDKQYTYDGKTYVMSNHGFARDMEFTLVEQSNNTLTLKLESSKETLVKYPFEFELYCWYRLEGRKVTCGWKVVNTGNKTMYFSIGAHPAFVCPLNAEDDRDQYLIRLDGQDEKTYRRINEMGLAKDDTTDIMIEGGILPFDRQLFGDDVLIFEENQAHKVALLTPDQKPYVTMNFKAPLFGLWTPAGKVAPFLCIEPWYGRCDKQDFTGNLSEREWGNELAPEKTFEASYEIILG